MFKVSSLPSGVFCYFKRRNVILFLAFCSILGWYAFRYQRTEGTSENTPPRYVNAVQNFTLGFSQVFVVSLPNRSDKRDAISIAASMTGIKFEWIDGVDGASVPEKAIPQGWSTEESPNTLGCWRAHMNAVQKMVKEQIPSALIMEDDADWDVMIKSQLVEFARGTRCLQNSQAKDAGPYGDDWDLLWLGHCGAKNREGEDQRYYIIKDDHTAVPQSQWGYPNRQPNFKPEAFSGTYTRAVFEPVRGLCMFGYALSLRGAQRLLYHQTMKGKAAVPDRALQSICNERYLGFKCFAPYPTLISTHKAAGRTAKDSDREDTTNNQGGFRKYGVTGGVVYSTRLNLDNLMKESNFIESQWPNDTMFRTAHVSFKIPRGQGVFVSSDQFKPVRRSG